MLAALAAAGIELALALLLVAGLAARLAEPGERTPPLVTFTAAELRPPSPPPPPPRRKSDPGEAAPRARQAAALPREAPVARIALAPPSPAASSAAAGDATRAGNPAGSGQGSGSGPGGEGSGSGAASPPVRMAGALRDSDYPRAAGGTGGVVAIAFRVRGDGRVDHCRVIASSGVAVLDQLTCRLVERRFRYRPARDAAGRPVPTELRTSFTWGTRRQG